MQYQTLLGAASTMAALLGAAKADFMIYQSLGTSEGIRTGPAASNSWMVADGVLTCGDFETKYAELPGYGDVSGGIGVRCDGCNDNGEAIDPGSQIKQIEINGDNLKWGHYTIYKSRGWELEPADHGPTKGKCSLDTSSNLTCFGGTVHSVFTCKSDLKGIHAR